jgi:acyl carrier protein
VSTRDDLIALVQSWDLAMPPEWNGGTSLVRTGVLDSLALYQLILWIEEQVGKPVDPTTIDLASELDTINDVVGFVERNRAR